MEKKKNKQEYGIPTQSASALSVSQDVVPNLLPRKEITF